MNSNNSKDQTQKELEQARATINQLESKVDMYQRVINHLPHYYTFWKDLDFRFLGGDERFVQKGGYSSMEDMIGKTDFDSAWSKEAEGFRNIDQMVVNQSLPCYSVIEKQTPADGKTVWLSTTKVAMKDEQNNVIGLVGVSDDVTEKLKREKLLRESESRFRQLSEASSEGVAIHKEGVITDTNLFLAGMFNYDAKELVGMPLVDLLADQSHATLREHLDANSTLPFRAIGIKNNPLKRLDAHLYFDVEITLRNDPIQAISIRDISQQVKVEKIKDDFLANTSHELRTPLNGIIGVSESLVAGVAGPLPEKVKANLSMIISSSRRLYNLVNDILDYSKMRNESLVLDKKPVNLRDITDLILSLTQPLIVDKPLLLQNAIPVDFPPVMADEDRLQQILYNLIGNAIKFTAEGQVTINGEIEDDKVLISVSDTGVGIPNSRQKEIFESFQQADSSTNRTYGGTGLGLTISRQLVGLHGSQLKVRSVPDKGSTFYFHLEKGDGVTTATTLTKKLPTLTSIAESVPLVHQDYASEPSDLQKFIPQGSGQKILVVDDEAINLQMIKNVLHLHKYEVLSAQSGFEAMDILKRERPDLVILDIMMPRMDGYELCALIRESFDSWQLPIIFLTAKNQVSDRVKGLSSGANDFLTKPFYQEELLIRVKTHLHVKESFETIRENQQLKIEIHRQKEAELELESTTRRICGILDTYEDALIAVNENLDVVYLNRQAEGVIGFNRDDCLNNPVNNILPEDRVDKFLEVLQDLDRHYGKDPDYHNQVDLQLIAKNGEVVKLKTEATAFEIDDECVYTFTAINEHQERTSKAPCTGSQESDSVNDEFRKSIRDKLLKSDSLAFLEIFVSDIVKDVVSSEIGDFESLPGKISYDSNKGKSFYQEDKFRKALVELMSLSVQCWKESTSKPKWQLAEESSLWRAYLDQGVYKTRTMNKYLKLETLPQKPKWNRVLETAEYVLNVHVGLRSENNLKLEEKLEELVKIINKHVITKK